MASASTALRVKELLRQNGWTTKILAEKTGMSESYLTHIKNGTRRWNQDSLERLALAFGVSPLDLFAQQRQRGEEVVSSVVVPENSETNVKVQVVPVVGDIPSQPSAYNNQVMQITTGCRDLFVPVANRIDSSMFALKLGNNQLAPVFEKNDLLIISPEVNSRSGDIAAVEYGNGTNLIRAIVKLTFTDEFIVLESVNSKQSPIALVRNKDHFRIIGRVIERHQNFID